MKNKKLLMPLAGVAALGAITPIVMTATACNKVTPDSTISRIEASTDRTDYYVGENIYRKDIKVTVFFKDSTAEQKVLRSDEWSCNEIDINKGYHFSEITLENPKVFTISYKGHSTTLKLTASAYAVLSFADAVPLNLCKTNAYATAEIPHVYGASVEKELREISLDELTITSSNTNAVVYDAKNHVLIAKQTSGTSTITAHYTALKDVKDYDATMTVTVNGDSLTTATFNETDKTASVQLNKASDTSNNYLKVPDYIQKTGAGLYQVVDIRSGTTGITDTSIVNMYIPEAVTNFVGGTDDIFFAKNQLRNVIYGGTIRQWNRISAPEGWAGHGCIGGYCLGESDWTDNFVYFSNCQGSTYDTKTKAFTSEEKVGKAIGSGKYSVEFDLALAVLDGETPANFTKLELTNAARVPIGSNLAIADIYIDGTKMTANTDYKIIEASRYALTCAFQDTAGGKQSFKEYSRIIVTFTTPGTSLNSVSAKLSKGA